MTRDRDRWVRALCEEASWAPVRREIDWGATFIFLVVFFSFLDLVVVRWGMAQKGNMFFA